MAIFNGTPFDDGYQGSGGADTILGIGGNDTLLGLGGNDFIDGGADNDIIDGGAGQDTLRGGDDDDQLMGDLDDDVIIGGNGFDYAFYTFATSGVNVSLQANLATGADGNDTLSGIEGLLGGAFNDTLTGDAGNNDLFGRPGNDVLEGGDGLDYLEGNDGDDTLLGGNEADFMFAGNGNDWIQGDAGWDIAYFVDNRSAYSIGTYGTGLVVNHEGIDTLSGIDRMDFADGTYAVVWYGDGRIAAEVVRTIFGAAAVSEKALVGQYLSMVEQGLTIQEITAVAVASDRFATAAGSHSNTDFVNFVYQNMYGSLPDVPTRDSLVAYLDSGAYTQASMGAIASEMNGIAGTDVGYTASPVAVVAGSEGADGSLTGTSGANVISARGGNDVLSGLAGSDTLDGGDGTDRAVFTGAKSSFLVTRNDIGLVVKDNGSSDTDQLASIERLSFTDISVAFDIGGNAGTAAKVIAAMFGIDALHDEALVGQYIAMLDAGGTEEAAAGVAAASARFLAEAGGDSNAQFVDRVYFNIAGFHPSPEDAGGFVHMLETGTTRAQLGTQGAETIYNILHADLVGLAQSGLEYTLA